MSDLRTKALERLISRRNRLSRQYDEMMAEPESYGITGSVSATNRKLDELRREISAVDDKIATLCGGRGSHSFISIHIPDYRDPYIHFEEELNGNC